ncbi:flagellin synthesis regulator FlgM [Fervidicella metallireducens AeB]|uniref:Negative regulator of flagellin synthesis n=1 Tax=Fervidicella metallireducens AeB TaxID=1403537 RepID=A0A017RXV4_9CLOT|nr:flagellar biosynthesis anti-sigma factor FlgM [Fervidicella metallireducens]EYE88775.1 flagellin synthesis regulator FlgM [Fervidicella metallireducens AeB]
MKIGLNVNKVINVYKQNTKVQTKENIKTNRYDRVELSVTGKEISKYVEMAKSSAIDDKRVEEIKKAIKNNTYEISTEKLAKGILNTMKESDIR